MAKLKSIFPFFGSIGEVTGYRGPDGVERVRKKSSLDKDRLHKDEAFAASRTAWPYLGMASQAGWAIRQALHPLLKNNKDYATSHRLVGACQKGLRRNHRDRTPEVFNFMDAKLELEGFSLVDGRSVRSYVKDLVVSKPDYGSGLLQIEVKDWHMSERDLQRSGATHLRWRVIVAALPQGKSDYRHFEVLDSEWFGLEGKRSGVQGLPPQAWVCEVPFTKYLAEGGQAIVAMGIEVAQRDGERYDVMASVKGFDILRVLDYGAFSWEDGLELGAVSRGVGSFDFGDGVDSLDEGLGYGSGDSFDGFDSLEEGLGYGSGDSSDGFDSLEVSEGLDSVGAVTIDAVDCLGGGEVSSAEGGAGVLFEEEVGRSVPSLRSGQAPSLWTSFEALVVAGVLAGALAAFAPSEQEGAGERDLGDACGERDLGDACGERDLGDACGERDLGDACGEWDLGDACGEWDLGDACGEWDLGSRAQGLVLKVEAENLMPAGSSAGDGFGASRGRDSSRVRLAVSASST
jgi:hypothetical protein